MVDRFSLFEVLVIAAVIGALGYFLTTPSVVQNAAIHIPVLGLQVIVSAYAGYKIFPKLFKNDDLEKYQESVLSSITSVIKADTPDRVHFAFSEAIQKIVGGIGSRVTTNFIKGQGKSMEAFIESIDGQTNISAAALGTRVLQILDNGPIAMDGPSPAKQVAPPESKPENKAANKAKSVKAET